ncbi:unnamed protein product [Prorocentrum cordatum]|uniref:Uncharacterized protein n=1 Tax=Prorocentrum cordatum TaxID=2364126 RepID=A0ABN9VUZ4_9DINO|nr:unnamed protein product [Polarella glacialis]
MALGRLVLSALVVCSAAVLAEEGTCAAEDGCDEVGLAQLRRAEARVALAVNASSKCSIGCDPHSNPIGRCPDLSDCPASGCCDKPGPTPAPTPSPSPPSGPCKVGCDPHSNPIGRCPDLSDCPASGCCDKAAPTPAPTPSPSPPSGPARWAAIPTPTRLAAALICPTAPPAWLLRQAGSDACADSRERVCLELLLLVASTRTVRQLWHRLEQSRVPPGLELPGLQRAVRRVFGLHQSRDLVPLA